MANEGVLADPGSIESEFDSMKSLGSLFRAACVNKLSTLGKISLLQCNFLDSSQQLKGQFIYSSVLSWSSVNFIVRKC